MSALKIYNEQAGAFGIKPENNVPDVAKLSFVRAQANEQCQIINRFLYDLTLTEIRLSGAKDETTKEAYSAKKAEYSKELRQLVETHNVTIGLVKELEDLVGQEG